MMVKWSNDGLLQANDDKILVNDGERLVNDDEMLINDGEMSIWQTMPAPDGKSVTQYYKLALSEFVTWY